MLHNKYLFLIIMILFQSIVIGASFFNSTEFAARSKSLLEPTPKKFIGEMSKKLIGGICTATPPDIMLKELVRKLQITLDEYNNDQNFEKTMKSLHAQAKEIAKLNEYNEKRKIICK